VLGSVCGRPAGRTRELLDGARALSNASTFFRQLLNNTSACALYVFGCKTKGRLAVVDPVGGGARQSRLHDLRSPHARAGGGSPNRRDAEAARRGARACPPLLLQLHAARAAPYWDSGYRGGSDHARARTVAARRGRGWARRGSRRRQRSVRGREGGGRTRRVRRDRHSHASGARLALASPGPAASRRGARLARHGRDRRAVRTPPLARTRGIA
jgi:hypothetical protein